MISSVHSQEIEETTTTTAGGGDVYRVRKLGKFIDWAVIVVANQAAFVVEADSSWHVCVTMQYLGAGVEIRYQPSSS